MMGENNFLVGSPEFQLRGEGVGRKEKRCVLSFVWKCHWKLNQAGPSPAVHFQAPFWPRLCHLQPHLGRREAWKK